MQSSFAVMVLSLFIQQFLKNIFKLGFNACISDKFIVNINSFKITELFLKKCRTVHITS